MASHAPAVDKFSTTFRQVTWPSRSLPRIIPFFSSSRVFKARSYRPEADHYYHYWRIVTKTCNESKRVRVTCTRKSQKSLDKRQLWSRGNMKSWSGEKSNNLVFGAAGTHSFLSVQSGIQFISSSVRGISGDIAI